MQQASSVVEVLSHVHELITMTLAEIRLAVIEAEGFTIKQVVCMRSTLKIMMLSDFVLYCWIYFRY